MNNKLLLFGVGYQGKMAYELLKNRYEIVCFADNNSELYGKKVFEKDIIPGNDVGNYVDDETDVLICSSLYYYEIGQQIKKIGIDHYYVFYDGDVYECGNESYNTSIRVCTRCVMDNSSDKYILFKENGECNYCTSALKRLPNEYFPNEEGKRKLDELLNEVKNEGKGKKYDCVMGISGGLDSSYLLYKGYQWGLRILAIHIDDGFDTDISKNNIEKLVKVTGVDYEVIRPDSVQYNDLTLSYMKAGVPNIAIPQDNVLFAFIYKRMKELGVKYFFSGGNFALESILQKGNSHNYLDVVNLLDIHKRFGCQRLDKLSFISEEQMQKDKAELGIESPRPLNYIDYNRDKALDELNEFCDFEYYGRKHLENVFTAFAQLYWFPTKFGVDKRKSHLSSMIVSRQIDRKVALEELKTPLYEEKTMDEYMNTIKDQFGINDAEFEKILNNPPVDHKKYVHI